MNVCVLKIAGDRRIPDDHWQAPKFWQAMDVKGAFPDVLPH